MHRRPSLFKACVFFLRLRLLLWVLPRRRTASSIACAGPRGELIVGTGSTSAPWHFQGSGRQVAGFRYRYRADGSQRVVQRPEQVEFVGAVVRCADSNLLTDKVDMSCQFITVTASRAQQVAFTLPYYREGVGLLLPANSKYKEIEDLKAANDSVTVAVLQNVYAEELVHQALPKAKVDQYDSVDLMYQAVNSGRADAMRHRPIFGQVPDDEP